MKYSLLVILNFVAYSIFSDGYCQCPGSENIYNKISALDSDNDLSDLQKLNAFYELKKISETCNDVKDSVYALVLLKLGKYEFRAKNNYELALNFTEKALEINTRSKKENSMLLAINGSYNIAYIYESLMLYGKALAYYDTVAFLCRNSVDIDRFVLDSRSQKANVYFVTGDYQKAVEESIRGMDLAVAEKDSSSYLFFLNRKAQSLYFEGDLEQALTDVKAAIPLANKLEDEYELGTAYKNKGFIYEKMKHFDSANFFYKQSVKARLLTNEYRQIASDFNDLGNFYLNSLSDHQKAEINYLKTIEYANKTENLSDRRLTVAMAYVNLGESYYRQSMLKQAENFYIAALKSLQIHIPDIKANPSSNMLGNVINKDLIIVLMNDKTALLLQLYKNTRQREFLDACMQTALVTDSVITQIRHEELGKQSKLYWRNKTRELFSNAMEACALAENMPLAFYFFEKSRAVLLNDDLNEIGALKHLPPDEESNRGNLLFNIMEDQQNLSTLSDTSKEFQAVQLQLLAAKEDFERYIKSLEQKYPAYYQYKYADEVPSLSDLQQYLAKNNQSFVHYFMGDTVTYILAITPQSTKFIRLSEKEFNREQLVRFLQLFSDKEKLNNSYPAFAALSNSMYKALFQKLQLPKGRVIICADNFLIPFDALCDDAGGKHFLLYDYTFSYVYSARYLMKQFSNPTAVGNFLGFAPVSFAPYLEVPDLKNAADALHASAAYYKNEKLFTGRNATRSNFFNYASSYSVVSIFSHALADTTDNEPELFMQDSVIRLSELQLLQNPAARLVLLSACQTNIGKNATGEGVYSLARGFSSAGIPSVVATLWKADEQTIYAISEKFNEYLSKGMSKDEALQKAKLFFIQTNSSEKMLPYYWANMILIGNTDAIDLNTKQNNYWWWIAPLAFAVLLTAIVLGKKLRPGLTQA